MTIDWMKQKAILSHIIRQAGEAVMQEYLNQSQCTLKDDDSPLTEADLISHKMIIEGLSKHFPNIPILSEESSELFLLKNPNDSFWCIDPIDGTKEFIEKNGEFTINIALISNKEPIVGLIFIPANDILYIAIKSKGAFRITGDIEERITVKDSVNEPVFAVSRSHINDKTKLYLSQFNELTLQSVGSSIKLCLVADGSVDCYPRLGPTSLWDIAAGHCLINEAGGIIIDEKNSVLTYDVSKSFLNNNFIAQSAAFLKANESNH